MQQRVVWSGLLALFCAVGPLAAQTRPLTGVVTRGGEAGQPVAEATIVVIAGTAGARTGADGKFKMEIPNGDVRLSVRAIGYQRKEVLVPAGASTVSIALSVDVFKLDEVVTTGQATTLEKRNATTSTARVDASEITNAPAASIEQALQGKVIGAQISMNGGGPGGAAQIQIRGITSILGAGQPLYVIDGTIVSNDAFSAGLNTVSFAAPSSGTADNRQDQQVNRLADLNPNEIESIEILKSAAATAIYGSRATNGVVVIKTKRGKPGEARVNITQRVGFSNPLKLIPVRQFTNVSQLYSLPYGNGGGNPLKLGTPDSTTPAFKYLNSAFPTGVIPASSNYNTQNDFYNKNRKPSYESIASLAGGSETFQYFASMDLKQEVGLANHTGARLESFRFNADQKLGKFNVSFNANISRNVLDRGIAGNDNSNTSPEYGIPYTPGLIDFSKKDSLGNYPINPFNGGGNANANPFQTFEYLKYTQSVFHQTGSTNVTYNAIANDNNRVVLGVLAGIDHYSQDGYLFSPPFLQYEGGTDGYLGRVVQSTTEGFNYNAQSSATWTYTGVKDVSFTTSAGSSVERQKTNNYNIRSRGTLPGQATTGTGNQITDVTQAFAEYRDQSVFANEQILAFNNKLSVQAGIRADRSSANGNIAKFYTFPRGSAAYSFNNLTSFISSLKLRGSVGQTGNRPLYGYRDVLGVGLIDAGAGGITAAQNIGNPAIKPERLTEFEGGTDITMFNERLQFEGTVYQRQITDLLLQPSAAPSSGYSTILINGGKLTTKGIELGLSVVPINSANVQWTSRVSFQKNQQKTNYLPSVISPFYVAAATAYYIAPDSITTHIYANVPVDASGKILPIGTRLVNPGAVAATKKLPIGDANPDFMMFFTNSVVYKRLTMTATVDWREGGLVRCGTCILYDEGGTTGDWADAPTAKNLPRGAILTGLPATTTTYGGSVPVPLTAGAYRYQASGGFGSFDGRVYWQDATWVRLRDVSVSYDAPASWAKAIGGKSLRFTLQGRNLLAYYPYYKGLEPEVSSTGSQNFRSQFELAPYPTARQGYLSVDVGF